MVTSASRTMSDFVLPDADGFDQNAVAAGGVEHGGDVRRRARQPTQRSARRHAADVNPRVREMILHADAVAQNRSAGVRTGRVHGDDADGLVVLAVVLGQLVDQRALAGSRRARQTENARMAGVGEESLEQFRPAGAAILDGGDGAGEGAGVAGAKTRNQRL